jgi:hypothetical protein
MPIVKTIHAQVGETVEIQWRNAQGERVIERHTAPPPATFEVRKEQESVAEAKE